MQNVVRKKKLKRKHTIGFKIVCFSYGKRQDKSTEMMYDIDSEDVIMGLFGFKRKEEDFVSPMEGKCLSLDQIEDPIFAKKAMGDGFAIDCISGSIVAPFNGVVTVISSRGHAIGLEREDGLKVLIHIGIESTACPSSCYKVRVLTGQKVEKGMTLIDVNVDEIRKLQGNVISPIIFVDGEKINLLKAGKYVRIQEDNIITIQK